MSRLVDKLGEFTIIPNSFIKQRHSSAAFTLFVVLRYHINVKRDDEDVFPSYVTLRDETGLSFTTIAKALKELMADGWVRRRKRFGTSTVYTLEYPSSTLETGVMEDNTVLQKLESSTPETSTKSSRNCRVTRRTQLDEQNKTIALTQHEKTITTVPVYSSKSKAPPDELPVLPTVATTTSPRQVPSTTDPRIRTYVLEFGIQPNDAQKFEIVDRIKANDPQWEKTLHDFHINEPERNWSRVGWLCDRYEQSNKPKPQRQQARNQPQQTRVPKGTRAPILEPDPHANDEVFKQLREMGMEI